MLVESFDRLLVSQISQPKCSSTVLVILLVLQFVNPETEAKTVSGVFNSHTAQAGKGQYVTSFAFHGKFGFMFGLYVFWMFGLFVFWMFGFYVFLMLYFIASSSALVVCVHFLSAKNKKKKF